MSTKRRQPSTPDLPDPLPEFGRRLLAAEDPLEAELLAALLLAMPRQEGIAPELGELLIAEIIENAGKGPSPESAALLRALAAVTPPHQRRLAIAALGKVTAAGHYPPEWAARIGRAVPGEAWRRYDVFEDTETIVVTFGYGVAGNAGEASQIGPAEHAVLVQVDRCREPAVLQVGLVRDAADLRSILDDAEDPLLRVEPIGLADARARVAVPLARVRPEADAELSDNTRFSLPIAHSRVRRLPADGAPEPRRYTAEDRSTAVAEFLSSPYAAEAGDEKVARFWAEVLAGYSASVPGDPPDRIGPVKLAHLLRFYVPCTFTLDEGQRRGLAGAVTAWTWWAADRQRLDEPARTELAERLQKVLAELDGRFADPYATGVRAYLADASATTTDAAALIDGLRRRAVAVPLPHDRGDDEHLVSLAATDPAHRRTLVEWLHRECPTPAGMSRPDFLAAAVRVCEELWHDDPPQVWQRARTLLETGTGIHDALHELAADPVTARGPAMSPTIASRSR